MLSHFTIQYQLLASIRWTIDLHFIVYGLVQCILVSRYCQNPINATLTAILYNRILILDSPRGGMPLNCGKPQEKHPGPVSWHPHHYPNSAGQVINEISILLNNIFKVRYYPASRFHSYITIRMSPQMCTVHPNLWLCIER